MLSVRALNTNTDEGTSKNIHLHSPLCVLYHMRIQMSIVIFRELLQKGVFLVMAKSNAQRQAEFRKRKKEKKGAEKATWMLIFYPDSAPAYWRDLLSRLHLKIWVSPLHDRDTWTEADEAEDNRHKAGQPKKPHYHLVVEYPSPVDRDTFVEDFKCLNGPQNVKYAKSKTSMLRYLTHKDDPDKAQYELSDTTIFGGATLEECNEIGEKEREKMLKDMRRFIRDNGYIDFCKFVDYCDENKPEWSHLLDKNSTYVIERYIHSYRASCKKRNHSCTSAEDNETVRIDKLTGEVIDCDEGE